MRFITALVIFCLTGTILPIQTPPARIPGHRFIDPLSIEHIWYRAQDCRHSTDPGRTLDGKRDVTECRRVIVRFGAVTARDDKGDKTVTEGSGVAVGASQSAYTGKTVIRYAPGRCKALHDANDSYVCGSSKSDPYEIWWFEDAAPKSSNIVQTTENE